MERLYIKQGYSDSFNKPGDGGRDILRYIKKALNYYDVTTFDPCCDADGTVKPVRYNETDSTVEFFNGTDWEAATVDASELTLTANRAVATDTDGHPVAATTTATELGYVHGVTSAIQTQLNSKATEVATPGTATSTGVAGQISYDATHIYVCIATNTWVRATLATW